MLTQVTMWRAVRRAHPVLKRRYSKSPLAEAFQKGDEDEASQRYRMQKTPVIPSVQQIEKRWSTMDAGKQDDVIAYLEDKMREDWKLMSKDEKRAAWHVWYGKWGPRGTHPTDMADLYLYFGGSIAMIVAGLTMYKYAVFDASGEVEGIDYE